MEQQTGIPQDILSKADALYNNPTPIGQWLKYAYILGRMEQVDAMQTTVDKAKKWDELGEKVKELWSGNSALIYIGNEVAHAFGKW